MFEFCVVKIKENQFFRPLKVGSNLRQKEKIFLIAGFFIYIQLFHIYNETAYLDNSDLFGIYRYIPSKPSRTDLEKVF